MVEGCQPRKDGHGSSEIPAPAQNTSSCAGDRYSIPQNELGEFAKIPHAVRRDLMRTMDAFRLMDAAGSLRAGAALAARSLGHRRGFTAGSLMRKHAAWLAAGRNWRAALDRSRAGSHFWTATQGLPEDFVDFWKRLCEQNQRGSKAAHRALIKQWRRWGAGDRRANIPGYTECPAPNPTTEIPDGWDYSNLMRRYKSTAFELTVARVGRSAAAAHRPLVYTTREDLWVGSHYVFDDLWHDHFVNVLDTKRTGRPLEFGALDLFSACKFAWGMRVRTENEFTGKMDGLKEEMMRMLVASVLARDGYSPRGTVMVVEHGTATIREDLEKLLHDITGGRITVCRGGMDGAGDALGIYAGRGRGNFRLKAAYESLHNLVHNEMAALPGQAGRSRDDRPEGTHGLLKHNDALLTALAGLERDNPERAGLLRFELLEFGQFLQVATDVYQRINSRTDHQLEGWRNNITTEKRGDIYRIRRMSPMEVWQRGRRDLTALPPEGIALVLGPDLGVERNVRGAVLEMDVKEVSPDALKFDTHQLPEGKYRVVFNPFAPDRIFAFDAANRLVGQCPRIWRVSRLDAEGLREQFKRVAKVEAEMLAPVIQRGAETLKAQIAARQHNAALVRPTPMSTEERREAAAAVGKIFGSESVGADPEPIEENNSDLGTTLLQALSTTDTEENTV